MAVIYNGSSWLEFCPLKSVRPSLCVRARLAAYSTDIWSTDIWSTDIWPTGIWPTQTYGQSILGWHTIGQKTLGWYLANRHLADIHLANRHLAYPQCNWHSQRTLTEGKGSLILLILTRSAEPFLILKIYFSFLPNNLSQWGGQGYWAFPFSESSMTLSSSADIGV